MSLTKYFNDYYSNYPGLLHSCKMIDETDNATYIGDKMPIKLKVDLEIGVYPSTNSY